MLSPGSSLSVVTMKCVVIVVCVLSCVSAVPESQEARSSDETENVSNDKPPAIIGSKPTFIWKYPYNAAVLSSSGILLGGGMVYNSRWIITAGVNAFILPASALIVRVGSNSAYRGGQKYHLAKVIVHPNYTGGDWDWNVGLLKLKRNIRFGRYVKAIRLSKRTPSNCTTAVVTGWGITNLQQTKQSDSNSAASKNGERLRYLKTDIIDTETCMRNWNVTINSRTYCGHVSNAGPCIADVGDPLAHKGVAVGIYVGGYLCGQDRYPDFYVDLAQFYDWIHETIQANSESSEFDHSREIYYNG